MSLLTGEAGLGRLEDAGGTVRDPGQTFAEVAAPHVPKECADRHSRFSLVPAVRPRGTLRPGAAEMPSIPCAGAHGANSPPGIHHGREKGAEDSPRRSRYRGKGWLPVRPHFRTTIGERAAWRVRRQRLGILPRHRHPACFSPPCRMENRKADRKGTGRPCTSITMMSGQTGNGSAAEADPVYGVPVITLQLRLAGTIETNVA